MFLGVPFNIAISIHALRKESDETADAIKRLDKISIHALRKESDLRWSWPLGRRDHKISIHALRKESDVKIMVLFGSMPK